MLVNDKNYKSVPLSGYGVKTIPCKNGMLTVAISKDGRERFIHSKYDPAGEARKQIDITREIEKSPTIMIFGLGMGYHVYEIQKLAPPDADIYIFEPCAEVLRLFVENNGLSIFKDERIKIYALSGNCGSEPQDTITLANCDAFSFFAHPVYMQIFRKEYDELADKTNRTATNLLTQKNTIRAFGMSWSVNFLKNYKYLSKSAAVKGLFGAFRGKSAIIVGAGPSLSKNVSELRNAKGKSVIICCDTAYRAIEPYGIKPDLLVSTSGSPKASTKLCGAKYDFPLVYKSQTIHSILSDHNGKKFYSSGTNDFLDEALEELGIDAGFLESGGSVACTCLDLAVKLGIYDIILVGVDLAFTEGKKYAEHATVPVSEKIIEKYMIETTDIYGKTVKSLQNLNTYKLWFESFIKNNPNVRVIDSTEGGALIKGTDIMPLHEALNSLKLSEFDPEEIINSTFEDNLLKEAAKETSKKYAAAFRDFLKAKSLTCKIIKEYKAETISHSLVSETVDALLFYTRAIKYSILTNIFDIKNKNVYCIPEVESFIVIADALEELTEPFEQITEE